VFNRGILRLRRTLVSGNRAINFPGVGREVHSTGTVTANNFKLFGAGNNAGVEGFSLGATDLRPFQALGDILNPTLAFSVGPTKTHVLASGSPALDAVTDGSCPPPARDQRGIPRPQDGDGDELADCDIGAVEVIP
jgi:hypothetical protein